MTAAARRHPPLELVPEPSRDQAADTHTTAFDDDWRAESVLQQWEPEHQLIGALMWLPAAKAKPILDLVPDDAIWRPINRWAFELIRSLVDAGRDPDPVVVLATARNHAYSQALQPDAAPTAVRHHQFAVHLAGAYTQTVSPAGAPSYAREVLDEAYRRALRTNGIRMQQLSECGAERAELGQQLQLIVDELADLQRRADTAAQPGWADTPAAEQPT